jgi:hypothetical protein
MTLIPNREHFISAPVEISERQFMDGLNVLPPAKWNNSADVETFYVPEPVYMDIVQWYARLGAKYYRLRNSRNLLGREVAAICKYDCPSADRAVSVPEDVQ